MELQYEVTQVNGNPAIHLLSSDGHVATIWGTVKPPESPFERANNIIEVLDKDNHYGAIIWGAVPRW